MENTKNLHLLIVGIVAAVLVCVLLIGMLGGFWPWQSNANDELPGESTVNTTGTEPSGETTLTDPTGDAQTNQTTDPSESNGNEGNGGGTTVNPKPSEGNGNGEDPKPNDGNGNGEDPKPNDGNGNGEDPKPSEGNGNGEDPKPSDGNGNNDETKPNEDPVPPLDPDEEAEEEDSDIKIDIAPDETQPEGETVEGTEPGDSKIEIDFNDF